MDAQDFYDVSNTKSHFEFERYLREVIKKPEERQDFYNRLIEKGVDLSQDIFRVYFEAYAAERKKNAQDFTPEDVASLMARIAVDKELKGETVYDGAAGSGALLVAQWEQLLRDSSLKFHAVEISDNAIPYLVHNLTLRKLDAVIVQGDTLERRAKQVYRLLDGTINILPHSQGVEAEYDIRGWDESEQSYFENKEIKQKYEA